MTGPDELFLRSLRAAFQVEAAEHLQTIESGLLKLEKAGASAEHPQAIETVYRAAHSLKGAARAVNLSEVESLCQSLEDLFAAWRRGESLPIPPALDTAHRAVTSMFQAIATSADAGGR